MRECIVLLHINIGYSIQNNQETEGKKMKGRQKKKRRISLFIFTITSVFIFFIPTGLTNEEITLGFKPNLGNIPPYQPTDPYPPDGATNLEIPVTLNVNVSDPDADPMDVYFYSALDDSIIGTDTVPNGSTASCTWSGLAPNTIYRWYVVANDSEYENTSSIWSFTTESSYGGGGGSPPPANQKPIAKVTGPDTGYVNEYISFSAQYSYDPDGDITGYRWDFNNDGLFDTDWIEDTLMTYTYFQPGNYSVKLQVKDDNDATSTDSYVITIIQQEPDQQSPVVQANGPYDGLVYENITFTGVGSYDPDGTIVNYTWDFGDGIIRYGVEIIHSYNISGIYNITLSVTDNYNLTSNNTTIANILIDSDGDGWSDEIEKSYGTNISDPNCQPLDSDSDGIPNNDSLDGNYTGDIDNDNDGLDDETENIFGTDPNNEVDVIELEIEEKTYYLINTNNDEQSDILYIPFTEENTIIKLIDGKLYLDTDNDSKWNYIYDPTTTQIMLYKPEEESIQLPLLFLIIIAIIVTIITFLFIRKHYEINHLIKQLSKLRKKQQIYKKRANKLRSTKRTNRKRASTYYHTKSRNSIIKTKIKSKIVSQKSDRKNHKKI
jgi:PKD repeat protein